MNPTKSFPPLQSNLQDMLPLPQAVHDTSAPNMQMQYQSPQQTFQTLVTSTQTNYEIQFTLLVYRQVMKIQFYLFIK